ncbi:MAG: hypothetical protein ACHBN1_35185 [Heteroscytonema crispum UTEX LB 1556]
MGRGGEGERGRWGDDLGRRVWGDDLGDYAPTNPTGEPVLGVLPSRSTRFTINHQPQRGDASWDARLLEGRFAIATA